MRSALAMRRLWRDAAIKIALEETQRNQVPTEGQPHETTQESVAGASAPVDVKASN